MSSTAASQKDREFEFSDQDFRFLVKMVYDKTKIQLADHKRNMVYSRLARRLRQLGFRSFSQYCDLINGPSGDEEMGFFVNAITTNLTHFFREKHHFEHLHQELLVPLMQKKQPRLRIWSAGCSSGMEPYSIAMTLRDAMKLYPSCNARILATDIDTNMLDRGKAGEYTDEEYDSIPPQYRNFVKKNNDGETMSMSPQLKELITFNQLNLHDPWPMKGPFDAIFCRNVVIYFDKPTQGELFNRMADLISPNGFLYIGHSENITKVTDRFQVIGRTIYRPVK